MEKCLYCRKNGTEECTGCSVKAGRDIVLEKMHKDYGIVDDCKLRNIVKASPVVLFKDLGKYFGVPFSVTNKITTNEAYTDCFEEKDWKKLRSLIKVYNPELYDQLTPVFNNIGYIDYYAGKVYGSSIHASGVLIDNKKMNIPIDSTGDCHFNGHNAEELNYIKFDMLSLSTLDTITELVGLDVDWNVMDWDIRDIKNMDLSFIFQFGSRVVDEMIENCPVGENTPEDNVELVTKLSEITSLNRPGCLNNGLNKLWIDIQNGDVKFNDDVRKYLEIIGD